MLGDNKIEIISVKAAFCLNQSNKSVRQKSLLGIERLFVTLSKAISWLHDLTRISKVRAFMLSECDWTKTGHCGILEPSDRDAIKVVSPFLEVLVDGCCLSQKDAIVVPKFLEYVDLLNFMFWRQLSLGWTEKYIYLLEKKSVAFDVHTAKTLGPYETSRMGLKFACTRLHLWSNQRSW